MIDGDVMKNNSDNKTKEINAIESETNDSQKTRVLKNRTLQTIKNIVITNNSHIYISAIFLIVGYIFYQLGYSFIYGYYFGGNSLLGKLMDVMVNQIPFDFKLIVTIGGFILLFSICFYISLHMYVSENKVNMKIVYLIFHLITVGALYLIIVLLTGNNNEEVNLILMYVTLLSSIILYLLLMWKIWNSSIIERFSTTIWRVTVTIINLSATILVNYKIINWMNSKHSLDTLINNFYYSVFILGQAIIITGLLDYIFFNKKDIKFIAYVRVIISIKRGKSKPVKKVENNKIEDKTNNNSTDSNKKGMIITLLIMILMIVMIYLMSYAFVNSLGNSLGKTLSLNTKSKITYYNTNKDENYKSIYGIVVQQTGNTYYISSENRELIVISSPYVFIEPYDK
ncbi:hypothetical protein [Clostridium sp.]|uniref:hypothetical protein n=1 Tax=Clostridium sp. TaxID=1506 RepID=UPI002851D563|nr:hypothetical protein [Clostridium sp.]MDR3594244.1 hypothetical protein [Clostridium sp.]